MDAVTVIKDKDTNHRLLQIDLDALGENEDDLEDIYDMIAIELHRNEETIPWEEAKKQLRNEGKL